MLKVNIVNNETAILNMKRLKSNMAMSAMLGNYREFKTASKEYASSAVKDYELAKSIPFPKIKAPLFSKVGLNMLKVCVLNFFRSKTPDEKLLKKLSLEEKLKKKYYEK